MVPKNDTSIYLFRPPDTEYVEHSEYVRVSSHNTDQSVVYINEIQRAHRSDNNVS